MVTSGLLPGISTERSRQFGGGSNTADLVDDLSLALLGALLPADARQILIEFGQSIQDANLPIEIDPPSLLAGLILSTPHFQIR